MHNMKQFGTLLQQFMQRDSLNQSDLARSCGKSPSAFNRFASGESLPAPDTLESILKKFTEAHDQRALVEAFLRDNLGDIAQSALRSAAQLQDQRSLAVTNTLSPRGQRALNHLLTLRATVPAIEDMFIDIARTVGWMDEVKTYPPIRGTAVTAGDETAEARAITAGQLKGRETAAAPLIKYPKPSK